MRPVKVLFDDGTDMAYPGGVKRGDKVIIDGQLRVMPGAKVTIRATPAARKKRQARDRP